MEGMPVGGAESSMVRRFIEPLYRVKGWMALVGILSIIGGVLQALTCIGIVVAWLPIWMGVVLHKAAKAVEDAYTADNAEAADEALSNVGTYFKIMGILALVGLVLGVVGFLLGLLMPAALMSLRMGSHGQ